MLSDHCKCNKTMDPDQTAEADLKVVREHAQKLGEHFDTVMIFVTRHESGEKNGTVRLRFGLGDWYARYGNVREWLVKSEEQIRIDAREDKNDTFN